MSGDTPICDCGHPLSPTPRAPGEPVVCEGCGRRHTAIGEQLGKARILELLGRGGMGIVYKARHVELDRIIAVKVLSPALLSDPEAVQRFYREARVAARIADPNVVQVYEVGREGERHYIIMEYADGRPLNEVLADEHPLPLARAVDYMEQMLHALQVVHDAGLLHRDVKPSNLIVDSRGRVKLTDFGLAKGSSPGDTVTQEAMILGTPHYMSPEQARGEPIDAQSDLYSMGVVFFEMLTGTLPYEGDTPVNLMMRHAASTPVPLVRLLNPAIPERLSALVAAMLSKTKERRIPTAARVLEELRAIRPVLGQAPRRDAIPKKSSRSKTSWIVVGAAVLLILAVAATVWSTWPKKTPAPEPSQVPRSEITPERTPDRPPDLTQRFADARRAVLERRWDDADTQYQDLEILCASRGDLIESLARVRANRSLLAAFRTLHRPLDAAQGGELLTRATALADPDDRQAWKTLLEPVRGEVEEWNRLRTAFDLVVAGWKDRTEPPPLMVESLRALFERPDHPVSREFQDWLAPRALGLLDRAELQVMNRQFESAISLYRVIAERLPFEPWKTKAQEGERGATSLRKSELAEQPRKPAFEIPLDFIPSEFVVESDGEHVLALNRGQGRLLRISISKRAVVGNVAVGSEPVALEEVGGCAFVCGRTGDAVEIVDLKEFRRVASIPLPSPKPISIAVARDADPPRAFVRTSRHIVEIDPVQRSVVRHAAVDPSTSPEYLLSVPSGERLFLGQGGDVSQWDTQGRLERTATVNSSCPYSLTLDGQGRYLIGAYGVYDHFLREQTRFDPVARFSVAVHPRLPFAVVLRSPGSGIELLDLHRLRLKRLDPQPPLSNLFIYNLPDQSTHPRLRLTPDARFAVAGVVQEPRFATDLSEPSTLYGIELPWKDPPGYFAFVSPPPSEAHPGSLFRHSVRVSAPYAATAKITAELMPDGMKWDEGKCELAWTPALSQIGPREIHLKAIHPASGEETRQVIPLRVAYRCVLNGVYQDEVRISADGRWLYSVREYPPALGAYDLQTDRVVAARYDVKPRKVAFAGGRVYAIHPQDGTVSSLRLPEGDDRKEHETGGRKALDLVSRGAAGAMLAVVAGKDSLYDLIEVGTSKNSVRAVLRDWEGVTISPDGNWLMARIPGFLELFRWQGDGYKGLPRTELSAGAVLFGDGGRFLLYESGIYETRGMRLLKRLDSAGGRLDPTGPFCAVPSGLSVEILALPDFRRTARIELKPEGFAGESPTSIRWAIPLSGRNRLVAETSCGVVVIPWSK